MPAWASEGLSEAQPHSPPRGGGGKTETTVLQEREGRRGSFILFFVHLSHFK